MTAARRAARQSASPPSAGAAIWGLAVGEMLAWAGAYYLFAALLLRWERDLGWSRTELSAALTVGLCVWALSAPLAGRVVDRGAGRLMLSLSALLGGAALAGLSLAQTLWQFYALWALVGLAMAGCLYDACFAEVARLRGAQARRAITLITLVAGFAGTLCFPVANLLSETFGWRAAALAFGGALALAGAPLFWFSAGALARLSPPRAAPAPDPIRPARSTNAPDAPQPAAFGRKPGFWLLAAALATPALNHGVILTHLLPLLDERGFSPAMAAAAAAAIGPMQVLGRLGMMAAGDGVPALRVTAVAFALMVLGPLTLYGVERAPILLALFAAFQGAGFGLLSMIRPLVAAELLGMENFGAATGALAAPFVAALAFASVFGALLWRAGGYDLAIAVSSFITLVGLGALTLAARMLTRTQLRTRPWSAS